MKSDFLTNEPKTIDGMVELYKNIGGYLGSKENGFENSVPKSVVLVPIQQVTKERKNCINKTSLFFKFCDSSEIAYKVDMYFARRGSKIISELHLNQNRLKKVQQQINRGILSIRNKIHKLFSCKCNFS